MFIDVFLRAVLRTLYFDSEPASDATLARFAEQRWGPYQGYAWLYLSTNTEVWAKPSKWANTNSQAKARMTTAAVALGPARAMSQNSSARPHPGASEPHGHERVAHGLSTHLQVDPRTLGTTPARGA
jgi:hypothetical protein